MLRVLPYFAYKSCYYYWSTFKRPLSNLPIQSCTAHSCSWSLSSGRQCWFEAFIVSCWSLKDSVNANVYGFEKWCFVDSGVIGETRPVERHQLEVLASVETITGALVVKTNDTNIADLSFLRNLHTIQGRQLEWVACVLTLHSVNYCQLQTRLMVHYCDITQASWYTNTLKNTHHFQFS